jgi:diguanylate cyclase (GGDEF)-like protein/PAS domain S-box-containing protein
VARFEARTLVPPHGREEPVLSVKATCRVGAALYLLCGSLVLIVGELIPYYPGASRTGIMALGGAAIAWGTVVWFLPWERWGPRASLWLVPVAFLLISLHGFFTGDDGFVYGTFFMVAMAWIGLAHPPGTSLAVSPLLLAAYLVPTLAVSPTDATGAWSAVYAVPACVLLGETVAWVAAKLRASEEAHRRGESYFRELFAATPQPMWVYHAHTFRFLEVNDAAVGRYGYTRDELLAMDLTGLAPTEDLSAFDSAGPWRYRLKDGRAIWVETTSRRIEFGGEPAVLVTVNDVTERKELEEQLLHQAFHDPLTGLANRMLFADRVNQVLARRGRLGRMAVLLLDLDGFKTVNDSLGHSTGDEILVAVAERIRTCLRPGETAARLGGDEFAVLLPEVAGVKDATDAATRLLATFQSPFSVAGKEIVVQASVGIASPGAGAVDSGELVRDADAAMYAAKAAGRGGYAVFEREMHARAVRNLKLDAELRQALSEGGLVLHYQPEVTLEGRDVVGFEALVRWKHPERGLVGPDEFIGRAEETGLIVALGEVVVEAACRQMAEWAAAIPDPPYVGVNLSARQLVQKGLAGAVEDVLERTGANPARLVVEVTENAILTDTAAARRNLDRLRALGVRVALDDFGTGYSSLDHLRTFPIDFVKIDRTFVSDLGSKRPGARHSQDRPVVAAIIALTESLGITSVAEGVETEEQASALAEMGCRVAQGFLFCRPVPVEQLTLPMAGQGGGQVRIA